MIENLSYGARTFTSNVFLLKGKRVHTALVDVGCDPAVLKNLGDIRLGRVVLTHKHFDHVDNLSAILEGQKGKGKGKGKGKEKGKPEVYCFDPSGSELKLEEGQKIKLGDLTFRVLHTPGHRNDSICLYNSSQKLLFTGDTYLPYGMFGRTDLEGGDQHAIIESLRKLVRLEVNTLYPGHGPVITGKEKSQYELRTALDNALSLFLFK